MRRQGGYRRRATGALLVALLLAAGCESSGSHGSPRPLPTAGSSSRTSQPATSQPELPVSLPTYDARQVLTVAAAAANATTATLQAWTRTGSGAWSPHGPPVRARVGQDGLTVHEHESSNATPIGSFTLTQAFGSRPDPGTRLPYIHTTPHDWWISEPGTLYNTHQVCAAKCPFHTGSPNTQLFYVKPQYDLAVVIDYNRRPVVPGAGSAVFLHVTRGLPTAGCVSVPSDDLATLMRWLEPQAHPRILIGVRR